MKFHFLTPVWGEDFTRRYITTFLPAQFPNLKNFSNSIYKIITTPEDAVVIRNSEVFRKLSSMMEVRIFLGLEDTDNNYRRMSHGYEIGMEGEPAGTPFIYLTPDSIWSLGSFDKLKKLVSRGYKAVLIPGLRVNLNAFLRDFRDYPEGVTGRQLSALAERHIHDQFRSFTYGENFHNSHPAALYWRVEGGLIARHFVLHPLLVQSRKAINIVEHTLDYNIATFVKRSETYICTDSDEILGVDVGLEDHCQDDIRPGPITDETVLTWFRSGWPTDFHKWLGCHTIFIHSKDIGVQHMQAARNAENVVKRIYRQMELPSFFNSPVRTTRLLLNMMCKRSLNFLRRRKSVNFLRQNLLNFVRRESLNLLQQELPNFLRQESSNFLHPESLSSLRQELDELHEKPAPPRLSHSRSLPGIDRLHVDDGANDIFRELYRGVEYVMISAVEGNIAEFGTSSGRTAMTLAKAMADYGKRYAYSDTAHKIESRKLFLFDSFEGFPVATNPIDMGTPHIISGVWGSGVTKDASSEVLLDMCATYLDPSSIEIRSGWYSESLSYLKPGTKFALVHIDCDFYGSTMDVLDCLFKNDAFSDGCVIYFDDWYCNRGSPDFGEQRAWAECVAKYKPQYSDWGGYATVGHRFIIHK